MLKLETGPLSQHDKRGHYIAGARISAGAQALTLAITHYVGLELVHMLFLSVSAGIIASGAAGIIKERFDLYRNNQLMKAGKQPQHGVERLDAIVTAQGGAEAVIPLLALAIMSVLLNI